MLPNTSFNVIDIARFFAVVYNLSQIYKGYFIGYISIYVVIVILHLLTIYLFWSKKRLEILRISCAIYHSLLSLLLVGVLIYGITQGDTEDLALYFLEYVFGPFLSVSLIHHMYKESFIYQPAE